MKFLDQILGIDPTDKTKGIKMTIFDPDGFVILEKIFQEKTKFIVTSENRRVFEFIFIKNHSI